MLKPEGYGRQQSYENPNRIRKDIQCKKGKTLLCTREVAANRILLGEEDLTMSSAQVKVERRQGPVNRQSDFG